MIEPNPNADIIVLVSPAGLLQELILSLMIVTLMFSIACFSQEYNTRIFILLQLHLGCVFPILKRIIWQSLYTYHCLLFRGSFRLFPTRAAISDTEWQKCFTPSKEWKGTRCSPHNQLSIWEMHAGELILSRIAEIEDRNVRWHVGHTMCLKLTHPTGG